MDQCGALFEARNALSDSDELFVQIDCGAHIEALKTKPSRRGIIFYTK